MTEPPYGSSPQTLLPSPHATVRAAARTQPDLVRYLLRALADEMADNQAVWTANGVSVLSQPNRPAPTWTAACNLALHILFKRMPYELLCNDELVSRVPRFPPSHCTRPHGHPGWHYEGESHCWGDPGEDHGQRDPWTGRPASEEVE